MLGIYARTSRENNLDSPIEQQIEAGITFANTHDFQYSLYVDKGISGYKINDDEETDPFSNRPEFSRLIDDIKKGIITSVWVWEHSRISRNQYASAFIFNIFEKYKIELYEKDTLFDLANPTTQMTRQILDAVAQYERQLIVARTTRGLYNAIDNGKRSYARFFGYKKTQKNKENNYEWVPVESELEQLKTWYEKYLSGKTLRSIIIDQLQNSNISTQETLKRSTKLGRFLAHAEYTGYCLKTTGLEIVHKYEKGEINNIQELKKSEYWTKCISYPVQLITIDEWVSVKERLQRNKDIKRRNDLPTRKAEKSLGTGLVKCGCCGERYYYYHMHYLSEKTHDFNDFYYYYHKKVMNNKLCSNKPKSLNIKKIDTILEIFFLFYVVFDKNTPETLKTAINTTNTEIAELHEQIDAINSEIDQKRRQIVKFNKALDETDDVSAIAVLATRISSNENDIVELSNKLASINQTLEDANDKLKKDEDNLLYLFSRNQLINFHENYNIEQKREILLNVIKDAVFQNDYLFIKAGSTIFVFNYKAEIEYPEDFYEEVKKNVTEEGIPDYGEPQELDEDISIDVPFDISDCKLAFVYHRKDSILIKKM